MVTGMTITRKTDARSLRIVSIAAVAVFGVAAGGVGAFADVNATATSSKPALVRRLEADEVKARVLESHIFAAQQNSGLIRTAALFGESDEEKAARLAHEQSQDASISQLNQRVDSLEDSLRRLTGQMEQLDHRLSEVNNKIDRMQKDFDYKICTMTQQQLGASGAGGVPCGAGGEQAPMNTQGFNPPPPQTDAPGPQRLAPPPSVLGSIPSNTPMPIPPPGDGAAPAGATPAANTARPQFDAAMTLLSKAQYDEARAAFRNFADTNPKNELTPQAVYWVGDIAYVQKDYPNAARAFAEEIKKYGNSPRAPDSMLKLGQSLIAMNQKQEGCTALGALQSKYPQASATIVGQVKASRKAAGCK